MARSHGRVLLNGTLPVGRTLHVRAYRWVRRAHRFTRRTSYRKLIQVSSSGGFRHRIASGDLARGKWKIVVKNRRRPMLQASAVLR